MTSPITPEQEEQVRRALAAAAEAEDAGASTRMPPAVAARLDGVLAELVRGRAASTGDDAAAADAAGPDAGRDQLAARRARRRLTVLVAAAAAVVVAAAGGTVATDGLGGFDGGRESAASSDSKAGDSRSGVVGPQPEALAPSGGPSGDRSDLSSRAEPLLRSGSLASDIRRVARSVPTDTSPGQDPLEGAARNRGCHRPVAPRGADVVDVRLDGVPSTLVLDPAKGGTREARVYSCADGSKPVATSTVPAR